MSFPSLIHCSIFLSVRAASVVPIAFAMFTWDVLSSSHELYEPESQEAVSVASDGGWVLAAGACGWMAAAGCGCTAAWGGGCFWDNVRTRSLTMRLMTVMQWVLMS